MARDLGLKPTGWWVSRGPEKAPGSVDSAQSFAAVSVPGTFAFFHLCIFWHLCIFSASRRWFGRTGRLMNIQRGDVLKARFPQASGGRGKKRPLVVVQADVYNQRLR